MLSRYFYLTQVVFGCGAGLLRCDGGGSHSASEEIVFMAREPSAGAARLTVHRPHASPRGEPSCLSGEHGTEVRPVDVHPPWRQTVYYMYISRDRKRIPQDSGCQFRVASLHVPGAPFDVCAARCAQSQSHVWKFFFHFSRNLLMAH